MIRKDLPIGYIDKKGLAAYLGLSRRTINNLLRHPTHPLPAYRPCEKLIFCLKEVDAWIQNFRAGVDLDGIVEECVREVTDD